MYIIFDISRPGTVVPRYRAGREKIFLARVPPVAGHTRPPRLSESDGGQADYTVFINAFYGSLKGLMGSP
jgi:hypothetical protein